MAAHVSILSSVSRTTLTQTFENPSSLATLKEVKYAFPIYDGVSVVAFTCTIGDRVVKGIVKEKHKARQIYQGAVDRGETAALLEQVPEAADVFLTSVGNVPPAATVKVEITYLGELKHDAEVDGIRYTIPTHISPRYGDYPGSMASANASLAEGKGGLEVVVDAQVPDGSVIKAVQSPTHPISVSVGTISTASDADPSLQKASATLALGSAELDKDFVIHVIATNTSNPTAVLQRHPDFPGERALMATLVPKFNLPSQRPEVVFVCDRSGSMSTGDRMGNLKTALQIFLKSLPVGIKFNLCSFGTHYSMLWDRSRTYDQSSLDEATSHVSNFSADMGGTEMSGPVAEVFKRRYKDMNLEVFVLTDGDVWRQEQLFNLIRSNVSESKGAIRLFTLGIGAGASSSLIEGAARAGNGFSQFVADGEKMNAKVMRMLKCALSPHISDYTLEVKYGEAAAGVTEQDDDDDDDGFEVIEKVDRAAKEKPSDAATLGKQQPISLFDPSADVDAPISDARYDHLPSVKAPNLLQAPSEIPPLYPFNRTNVYVLLSGETAQRPVRSVVLRGRSAYGPVELEIPVTTMEQPGETIHQLAARKVVKELEEGTGWLCRAKTEDRQRLLKDKYDGLFSEMVEREAVRLGVKYQVGGKWCSFVAVEEQPAADGSGARDTVELPPVEASGAKAYRHLYARSHDAPLYRTGGVSASPRVSRRSQVQESERLALGPTMDTAVPESAVMSMCEAPGGPMAESSSTFGAAAPRGPLLGRAGPAAPMPMSNHPSALKSKGKKSVAARGHTQHSIFGSSPAPVPAEANKDPLDVIVAHQTFEGYWPASKELFETLGITVEQARDAMAKDGSRWSEGMDKLEKEVRDCVVATVAVLVFLESKLKGDEEVWEMMAEKACGWLEAMIGAKFERDEARKYLGGLF